MNTRMIMLLIATGMLLATRGAHAASPPQQDDINRCNAEATQKGLDGYARSHYVRECLGGGKAVDLTVRQEKIAACDKEAAKKELTGTPRKQFMRSCLSRK